MRELEPEGRFEEVFTLPLLVGLVLRSRNIRLKTIESLSHDRIEGVGVGLIEEGGDTIWGTRRLSKENACRVHVRASC